MFYSDQVIEPFDEPPTAFQKTANPAFQKIFSGLPTIELLVSALNQGLNFKDIGCRFGANIEPLTNRLIGHPDGTSEKDFILKVGNQNRYQSDKDFIFIFKPDGSTPVTIRDKTIITKPPTHHHVCGHHNTRMILPFDGSCVISNMPNVGTLVIGKPSFKKINGQTGRLNIHVSRLMDVMTTHAGLKDFSPLLQATPRKKHPTPKDHPKV